MKIHFLDYMSWYWKLPSSKKERGKKGHDGLWFISSDRYLNGEILRAWPRARHGMEWQLKLDSSYFKRYFSPLWLRFFSSSSSSSSSLLIFSPRFPGFSLLASVEYFWSKRNSLLWWERERDSMIVSLRRQWEAPFYSSASSSRKERRVNVGRWEFYGDRTFMKVVLCAEGRQVTVMEDRSSHL